MTRTPRLAAVACLGMALLAQLLLPAVHVVVHRLEQQHDHADVHQRGEHGRRWNITRANGAARRTQAQQARARRDGQARLLVPGAAHHHHHDGDAPGDRHGGQAPEHLGAFFLEASPPALAIPYRRVAPSVVAMVVGRQLAVAPVRAHAVRGPPRRS